MTLNQQLETGDGLATSLGHRNGASARHSHVAHFYTSDPVLVVEVSQSLSNSLGAGGSAVIIATPAHIEAFEQQLTLRGFDLRRIARQGRWLALDAAATLNTFMDHGWPDEKKFASQMNAVLDRVSAGAAAVNGAREPYIAGYGEMVSVLWEQGKTSASLRLEELWNRLLRGRPFHLSCGWPMRLFPSEADSISIRRICALHTGVSNVHSSISGSHPRRDGSLWQLKARALLQNVSHIARQTLGFYREADSVAAMPITVSGAIDEVLAVHEHRLRDREIELRRFIRPDARVVAPLGEFKHILSCLIANAIDASVPGNEITLSAWKARHPVTGVQGIRLSVVDQGIGIPDAIIRDVFTPFFATTRDINIGLGLWVVKDILDRRGGSIRCRSRVAQPSGTVMMVFLPSEQLQIEAAA
ncbi:MAG TPA: ATP-binding protein [Acidobacteriaceae bacterium]|nr:ATP-binding protein [Acidobacteriaceae bacterium]